MKTTPVWRSAVGVDRNANVGVRVVADSSSLIDARTPPVVVGAGEDHFGTCLAEKVGDAHRDIEVVLRFGVAIVGGRPNRVAGSRFGADIDGLIDLLGVLRVLAVVAGGLRSWLLTRGELVTAKSVVRAMVPLSVRTESEAGVLGNRVASYLVDLPVGEPSPVVRLHQVSYAMQAHKETGQAIGAEALVSLAGFAPPTLHSLGARVGSGLSRRLFNLVVTNVPGPQFPLYAAGAELLATYPVVPLAKGQAVSVGVTSYNGRLFFGLNADRDAMADVDVLAQCISDALSELRETAR